MMLISVLEIEDIQLFVIAEAPSGYNFDELFVKAHYIILNV